MKRGYITMNTCYVVNGYINGACCLSAAYKRKGTAIKSYDKRVKSACYDRVELMLQNAVYFSDTALLLHSWSK